MENNVFKPRNKKEEDLMRVACWGYACGLDGLPYSEFVRMLNKYMLEHHMVKEE